MTKQSSLLYLRSIYFRLDVGWVLQQMIEFCSIADNRLHNSSESFSLTRDRMLILRNHKVAKESQECFASDFKFMRQFCKLQALNILTVKKEKFMASETFKYINM